MFRVAPSQILANELVGPGPEAAQVVGDLLRSHVRCEQVKKQRPATGEHGAIVTLLCDGGERYATTYYDDAWLAAKGLEWQSHAADIATFLA